jgi:P pilus assembly chaperone PapD
VLLRVNLPVFAAAHARAAVSSPQWRWQLGVLSAHNAGSRHVQLKQVQISDADGNHLQLGMRYVLAGAEAAWTLPDAWRDRAIKVDADSDGGPLSVSLDATRLDAVLPETLRLDTTRAARGTFDAASAAHP